ncbi:hypothetical protein AWC38_SpisGene1570 [Stylophora pistillata]|uniref:Non-lysosomal glucosylceramidase n=1 Tax=Stylophora pistillata TaxID=50429 RepID=A0A2B4SVZ5_STYPI|nr:hypothetical protein AWC38_SpisGene1570 [Stylophora pistillata]
MGDDRFLERGAGLGSIHPPNSKLKEPQLSFEEGRNRNESNIKGGKFRKQYYHQIKRILSAKRKRTESRINRKRHETISRLKDKKMNKKETKLDKFQIFQKRKKSFNDDKCNIRRITNNTTLYSGMDAGKFKLHGKSKGISACARLCCQDRLCDIAVIMTDRCYTVQCYSMEDCQSKTSESKAPNIVIAYVNNSRKVFSDESRHNSETDHRKREEMSKKTMMPNPNGADIGDTLEKIKFLNGPSVVTSDMKFSFLQQCALYVEPENATKPVHGWVTPRYSPVKYLYQAPRGTPPPLGMRSAVPLGGMGTGSLELRADGSFHEWTLENQSPGGSAKLGPGALDKAVLGVRVSSSLGTKAALLRTHPPPGYPGVKGLSYSGSFPVSRLSVEDERFFGVEMDLFAYGTLRARKAELSFVPGVVLTLNVKNPTDKEVDVSFLFNIPLGEQPDTSRRGDNIGTRVDVVSSAQCAAMCNEDEHCMAWSYEEDRCSLKDAMPLHAYQEGVTSGVKGRWKTKGEMLTCQRPKNFPNSGSTTLLSINTNKPTFAVTDDFRSVWEAFESSGKLRKRIDSSGFHGTIAVKARLPSGISETLTFILAWYYPYRDHSGQSVGQYYSNLFNSSTDVAEHIRDNLLAILKDIISWQSNIILSTPIRTPARNHAVKSSLPDWLQDHLVNSLSFWRSGFRVADGRWRQWEALDCNDVDSVHNDFQRELPYLIFFPELLDNVVRAWARYQHQDGWIQETLQIQWGCHNRTNRLNTPGGRVMADVTPAFLAQFYHLYLWTGNRQILRDLWPAARKALIWLIRDSTGGSGLPLRKTCTYDIIYLEGYDHTTYNSVMYLLGLRVGQVLADTVGETELARVIQLAFEYGKARIDRTLWDEEEGFYHSWWDHEKGSLPWLMADSLYGQVWAYALGLGNLLDPIKMKMHLNKERELNDTPYGLRVLTQGINRGTKKTNNAKQKLRQKRKTRKEEEAVVHLDSFFSEVSEFRDPHFNKLSNFTAKKSKLKAKMHYDNYKTNRHTAHHLSAAKKSVMKVDMKIKTRKRNETEKGLDKQFNSTSISIQSVTQKSLKHDNCFALEQESKFNSIWMGSDADWTTLNIHLGMDPSKALKQAEKALEHYRTKLNDLWNIHGLTAGQGYGVDGQPWCTSHYSFHMVLWHIPLALSGQQYNAVKERLIFEPKLQVPYVLPFFTPFASGTIQARKLEERIKHIVTVTSGRLELKFLAVSKSMFPNKKIELSEGEFVSWERK